MPTTSTRPLALLANSLLALLVILGSSMGQVAHAKGSKKADDKARAALEKAEAKAHAALEKTDEKVRAALEKAFEKNAKEYEKQFANLRKLFEKAGKAKKKGKKKKHAKLKDQISELKKDLAKHGQINPTNVPIVTSDFLDFSMHDDQPLGSVVPRIAATGQGVVVAVLDSGFNLSHPTIADNLFPFSYDAVGLDLDAEDRGNGFDDDYDGQVDDGVGHGTFVTGMVLSVAPDAVILPVRVADDEGYGSEREIADGIQFAIDMRVDVINLSLEAGSRTKAIELLLKNAREQGIVVVVSAGNAGENKLGVLADSKDVLAVGAVDDDGYEATFSNSSGKRQPPTIYAPGVDLFGPYGSPTDHAMCVWSGTSFAAGIVTGAAAVAIEQYRYLDAKQIVELLRSAVDPVYDDNGKQISKTGSINIEKLLQQR